MKNTHNNLKTIPCWICNERTIAGVEAIRVICPDCVSAGHGSFGRKAFHVAPEPQPEPETAAPAAPL